MEAESTTRRKLFYACSVIVVGACLGTFLFWLINGATFSFNHGGEDSCSIPDPRKFDCHPDRPISEEECLRRGCCYKPASDLRVRDSDLLNSSYLGVPSCFFPDNYMGYEVQSSQKTSDGITADLQRKGQSGFSKDVQHVRLIVSFIDDATLRIKLEDANNTRFEPNIQINHNKKVKENKLLYDVVLGSDDILTVKRKNDGMVVFRTRLSQLVFSDQFLQLSTEVSSSQLYGLGEHKEGVRKSFNWARYTLFNQGDLPVPNRNLYGSHPFYIVLEPSGQANGLFLLNSNAMDAVLQPAPAVSFRTVGGILDFFLFLGPTPGDVVKQYTGVVGRPFMVPYWSLGFHLCRYGYNTLEITNATLQRNLDAGVPVDVQWNDIDFMKRYLDFTYDPIRFAALPKYVKDLHEKGMHYIAMISPGVSNVEARGSYPPYDEAAKELLVKDADGIAIEAKVWNTNYTVFPDFSHPSTAKYWERQFEKYHSELDFDGIWIDMNEPLNFLNGSTNGCPRSEIEDPQYLPGRPYPLRTMTLCMTAKHHSTIHYNEHNLVAYREAHATYDALRNIRKKRPFIISRATFSGQGVYSGHWSGDITSDWEDMRYTIPSMLIFNMYGMPMIGSDICGFRLNTTTDLCTRWQALGAFYPFSRNHNDFDTTEQDPAYMGGNVLEATKINLRTRYYLLPYFYTLFHKSHVFGETPVRPLFFEFPSDKNTFDINEEFLWGPALLVIPALYEGKNQINAYYPKGVWYDFYTGQRLISSGMDWILEVEPTTVRLNVRDGHVLPLQLPANNTKESRKNPFDLLVALDAEGQAVGDLYWDDGDSLDTYENGAFNEILFSVKNNVFTSTVSKKGHLTEMNLNEIKIMGLDKGPYNVTVNGKPGNYEFKKPNLIINVTGFTLLENLTVEWSEFKL